jgi:hypothetical protein
MSRPRIARVLPAEQLAKSQRDLGLQLSDVVAQFERQADSLFYENTWIDVGWPELADCFETNITALIRLAQRWGLSPEWALTQRAAYDRSALGQRMDRKRKTQNNGNGAEPAQ